MALVPTVTELDPTDQHIRAKLVLMDGAIEVVNRVFQEKYDLAIGPNAHTRKRLTKQMKMAIDAHNAIKAVKAKPAFGTVFGDIQDDLEVYIGT